MIELEIEAKDVGLIRVVGVSEDDNPYAEAFLGREVICAYRNGTLYVALMGHALAALEEDEPEALEYYREQAEKIPEDKIACVVFESECVEELAPVMTETEFMNWCQWQIN